MGSVICKVSATKLGDKTVGRIVGLKTLGDAEIVDEALRKAYVSGQANIILGNICGVMKSMSDASRRDGNGRKIDSVCSIQPWMKGRLDDPSDPLDTSKVKVALKARALKEINIDVSNWTFVIEGATGTVVINAVSTGETVGEIVLGEAVHVTGKELAMGEGDSIGWEIPEDGRHGNVSPTKVTSDAHHPRGGRVPGHRPRTGPGRQDHRSHVHDRQPQGRQVGSPQVRRLRERRKRKWKR